MKAVKKPIHHKPAYAPKITQSVILVCSGCKNRYIKTRHLQMTCVKCLVKARDRA